MKRISKTVFVLGLVSFFTDCSSEMIYPLLPVFLSTQLAASPLVLGVIEGFAEATASLFKLLSGLWTDRLTHRKPLILSGYTLSGVMRPLIGLAASWPMVLLIRVMDRVGKGLRSSPRDSLIADITAHNARGAAYGFHRAMDHAGAAVGPLIGGALLLLPGMSMRSVFLLAAIPALAASATLLFFLKEKPAAPSVSITDASTGWIIRPSELKTSFQAIGSQTRRLLLAFFIFTVGNSTDAFLLLKLTSSGVSTSSVALLWSLHHVIKMGANYYGGRFVDWRGARLALLVGWVLYALFYGGFALSDKQTIIVFLFLGYGIHYGFIEPAEKTLVAALTPPSVRGTAFGAYHFIEGLGALPASLFFGYIWHAFGEFYAFTYGALTATVASVLILLFVRNPQPHEDGKDVRTLLTAEDS